MARRKRTSSALEAAHQRLAGLNSITPASDLGANLSLAVYMTQVNEFSTKLDHYNQMVSALDDLQNQLDDAESDLRETSKRMLAAVEAHYGPDSSQYEQAGGTRQSDRKRPVRKPSTSPAG
ncbi:MAG: hypothetical protein WBV94_21200 [Blastocatellia bacterium]